MIKKLVSKENKVSRKEALKIVSKIESFGMIQFGKKVDSMGEKFTATREMVINEINMGGCLIMKSETGIKIRACSDVSYYANF